MGNAIRRSRMRREDYDESFPIDSLFGDIHRILTPPTSLPTCLDELIDWAAAASIMVSYLQENDRGSPLCRRGGPKMIDGDGLRFVPRMMILDGDTNVKELPTKWLEKAAILAQQIVVVVESRDNGAFLCCLTGFQFCKYHALLCQLTDLMTLEVQARTRETKLVTSVRECNICQNHMEAIVCSCSQGVCDKCQEKWVQRCLNCPFCRTHFANQKDMDQTQWELTDWNPKMVERDIAVKLEEERDFWTTIPRPVTEDEVLKNNWPPLKRSVQCNKEENDFLLL